MPRRLRTAAVSLALLGALAACGGGSSSSSSKTTDSKGNTAATNGSGGTNDGSSDTSAPVDTNFSGEGSTALCSYATDLESSNVSNDLASGDLKTSLTKLNDILKTIKDKAPAEIKDDVNTMLGGYQKMIELYGKYDYDPAKLIAAASTDPDLTAQLAALSDPTVAAASERVTAYFANVCGVNTSTT